ncbi:hypothetical protein [Nostoc sp. UIC 10630]|uniref:hypothetical protein n=1 Tax=Nostoc sp. UIC 10630 TaxID=2100146 RepID=UPI0013D11799|nr:hypothetical protein [Nostoc sp. UIC 10630]NEU80390.1 hypothetical protein [Nostoc sp. UIC 10630]
MEIQNKFSFLGNLRKLHEEDNQPIENFIANILCFQNGNIFIDIDSGIKESFSYKFFYESADIKSKKSLEIIENKNLYRLVISQTDDLEEELIQTPYEGDYIIEGITSEGWAIKANIANANFTINHQHFAVNTQNYLIRLSDLYIDYNSECISGKTIESIYGMSNLEILYNFSTLFLDSKCEFSLVSAYIGNKEADILSAEMIFKIIDKNNTEEIPFNTYFAWFELLISFATGKSIKEIYRIEITQSSSGKKKIEYWSGSQVFIKGGGVAVIQQPYLHLFIQQCASKVT